MNNPQRPTDAGQEGPVPLPVKLVCDGCRHLELKDWREELENDEVDSGTTARCGVVPTKYGGRLVTSWWRKGNATPRWCPFLARAALSASGGDAAELAAADMRAEVAQMQADFRNPIHQVALRAGFILCREVMARFVEQGGDAQSAASIRANWLPALGEDPGGPRKYDFAEIAQADDMENGPWESRNPGACVEGAVYALCAMSQFGLALPLAKQEQS